MYEMRDLVRLVLSRYGRFVEFPRGWSFDFLYRDSKNRLLIKAFKDLDSLRHEVAEDLKRFSKTFDSSPLVVSLLRRGEPLIPGVVYIRYEVPAVSPRTLKEALEGYLPIFVEYRGGLRMFLKKEVLKKFSRNFIARVLEVSKRTVYEYQRGLGLSASKYEKVSRYLGEDAIERIDFLNREVEPEAGEPKDELDLIIARLAEKFERAFRFNKRPGRSAMITEDVRVVISINKEEAKVLYAAKRHTKTPALYLGKDDEVPSIRPEEIEKVKKEDLIELLS